MTPAELRALVEAATPGPWRYRTHDRRVLDAEDSYVAWVHVHHEHPFYGDTARLIALAPDLALLVAEMGEILLWATTTPVSGLWQAQEDVDRVRAVLTSLAVLGENLEQT